MRDEMIVGGYLFGTAADAQLAREELDKVRYLDANMNYANTGRVMQLYERALDTKMFRTPPGLDYMNKLRGILSDSGYADEELRPIPLYTIFARTDDGTSLSQRIKPAAKKPDPYKRKYLISVMMCAVLIIMAAAMFIITLQSDTPNMINYRNAIVNEYATWEQDIRNRENAVRAKERELNITVSGQDAQSENEQSEENNPDTGTESMED